MGMSILRKGRKKEKGHSSPGPENGYEIFLKL
jgi:hypothetical protein